MQKKGWTLKSTLKSQLIPIKCLLNTKPCLKGVAFGLGEINENI